MPIYVYKHPETGKIVEVIQGMNDKHEYEENGVGFKRVFLLPHAATDTHTDPFSKKDFMRRTHKKMTIGDMMDESAALSEKRAKKAGIDPVKAKTIADYEKLTKKRHPSKRKGERFENKHFIMDT